MDYYIENSPVFLILIFTMIAFVQSGLDKLLDWHGNLGWLKDHFQPTFLRNMVPFMLGTILVLELAAGFAAVIGILFLFGKNEAIALVSLLLAACTLLLLFFGQRVAKDYAGAFTLTGYFLVVVFGIFLLLS